MQNINRPPLEVRHAKLRRADDGVHKSMCPACVEGLLLMHRDPASHKLKREDRCVSCGQRVIYIDLIEDVELRTRPAP